MKKRILFLLLVIFSFCLFACNGKKEDEVDWTKKTVDHIEIVESTIAGEYEYDEFSLDMIHIMIYYTDGTSREIPTDDTMYDGDSLRKFEGTGTPRIDLFYEDPSNGALFDLQFKVKLIDSSLLDEGLNREKNYDVVVKAIRNKTKNQIDFIVEACETGITSFQFEYTYDNAIMQLSNFYQNPNLSGIFDYTIADGKITVTIILSKPITEELTLFSVNFAGNFRTSGLKVNPDFNNEIYLVNGAETTKYNCLYHASIK